MPNRPTRSRKSRARVSLFSLGYPHRSTHSTPIVLSALMPVRRDGHLASVPACSGVCKCKRTRLSGCPELFTRQAAGVHAAGILVCRANALMTGARAVVCCGPRVGRMVHSRRLTHGWLGEIKGTWVWCERVVVRRSENRQGKRVLASGNRGYGGGSGLGLGTGLIKMPPLRHNHGHHHLPPYAMHASSGQPRVWAQAHRQHRQLRPSAPAGHLHTWPPGNAGRGKS